MSSRPASPEDGIMTPGEVAALFRVDAKTVTRWAKQGRLTCFMTPGGHRRYRESEVRALVDEDYARDLGQLEHDKAVLMRLVAEMLSTFVDHANGATRSGWLNANRVTEWHQTYRRLT